VSDALSETSDSSIKLKRENESLFSVFMHRDLQINFLYSGKEPVKAGRIVS